MVYIAEDDDIIELSIMLDDMQSSIIDEDIMELSIDDDIIELSIGGQLEDEDIIELSIAELDELCAKPGTTAAAKLPATRSAATIASSFFTITLPEGWFLQSPKPRNFDLASSNSLTRIHDTVMEPSRAGEVDIANFHQSAPPSLTAR